MSGRKHHLQQFGYMNMDWNKIQDPVERDFAFKQLGVTPYCVFCGEPILDSETDKNASAVNWKWEQRNSMHYRCMLTAKEKREREERLEAVKKEIEKKEKEKDFNWDNYIQEMLSKKED